MTDIPQVTEEQMSQAVLRVGGRTVSRGKVRVMMFLNTVRLRVRALLLQASARNE